MSFVLTIPLLILLRVFARERTARLDGVLELSHAYRGTALLLGDVVEADDGYTGSHSRHVVDLVHCGRRPDSASMRVLGGGPSSRPCSTTSARSESRTPSSTKPGPLDVRELGIDADPHDPKATRCSNGSAAYWATWDAWCARATNVGTERAIQMA
jgi:hypothetical protein